MESDGKFLRPFLILLFIVILSPVPAITPTKEQLLVNPERPLPAQEPFVTQASLNNHSLKLSDTMSVHDPIYINSNQELEQFISTEGFPGNGTITSPYVISHLNVSRISIKNTNKHVLITENLLHDPDENSFQTLISIENASNIKITNNHFLEWYLSGSSERRKEAVYVKNAHFIAITNNVFESLLYGVFMYSSTNIVISSNQFIAIYSETISQTRTNSTTIYNNTLSLNLDSQNYHSLAINIQNSENITYLSNTITNYLKAFYLENIAFALFEDLTIIVLDNPEIYGEALLLIHVNGATEVYFSNLNILDQRPLVDPQPEQPVSVAFLFWGPLNHLVITESSFHGVQRVIDSYGTNISSLLINGSTFSSVSEAICLWGSNYENQNISIKNNVFLNITHYNIIRIGDPTSNLIRNISIEHNLFLSTTIIGSEIGATNIDSLRIYRNNFINRIGSTIVKSPHEIIYYTNATNVFVSENYFASFLGFDENNDNIMDVFNTYLIMDASPAVRPWPSRNYPYIYISPFISHFKSEVFFGNTYRLEWIHAADTWGFNYSYDIHLVSVGGKEVLVKQNHTQNFIDILFDSNKFPGGKAYFKIQVYKINGSTLQPMGSVKSNFFTIYSLPSNTGGNNQGKPRPPSTSAPTETSELSTLELPFSDLDLFDGSEIALTLASLFLLVFVVKKKKPRKS